MKVKTNFKLNLSRAERNSLRSHGFKIPQLLDLLLGELAVVLQSTDVRTKKLDALAIFQTILSMGIRFAEDLLFLGYYFITQLKKQRGRP
jgi:hypothetical protein